MDDLKNIELIIAGSMFGVIWLVQLVIYPSFLHLEKNSFRLAMKHHQNKISYVVIPLMLVEIFVALILVITTPQTLQVLTLIIVLSIWIVTFTQQVPHHHKLLFDGFDERRIKNLVASNWTRTGLWTVKLIVVLVNQT